MFELLFHRPPSVNDYWKPKWKARKFYLSKEAKEFREHVKAVLRAHRIEAVQGYFRVTVEIHQDPALPPEQTVDVDNCNKALLDAMEHGGAYANDRGARSLHVDMKKTAGPSFVLVRVEEMDW